MAETVLIVDDEESVRKTLFEWLNASQWNIDILVASDAESALVLANEQTIDLAILDWNLGSGSDGLQLLEDLFEFQPDIVAILVTGFAHQATPLDALRMGVRDYLDKNQDLNRDSFLAAVEKQLRKIVPAKNYRLFHEQLRNFRDAVQELIPLVEKSNRLSSHVGLPEIVPNALGFAKYLIPCEQLVMLILEQAGNRLEVVAYQIDGSHVEVTPELFPHSMAAMALSIGKSTLASNYHDELLGMKLLPFEVAHRHALLVPMIIGNHHTGVLQFLRSDKSFDSSAENLSNLLGNIVCDIMRMIFEDKNIRERLLEAINRALQESGRIDIQPQSTTESSAAYQRLQVGAKLISDLPGSSESELELLDELRQLNLRHGDIAIQHALASIQLVRKLLDAYAG
ncbi:MAG: response regulator [Zavarzinella sp.]